MWSYFKITCWAILWLILWIFMLPFKGKRDNCLTWAMRKQDSEGGYLVIRWCRTNRIKGLKWPHFLWLDETHHKYLQHYIPKKKNHDEKVIPCPWFHGYVKKGDDKSNSSEN